MKTKIQSLLLLYLRALLAFWLAGCIEPENFTMQPASRPQGAPGAAISSPDRPMRSLDHELISTTPLDLR